jgi:hypothetical protein
VFSKDQEVSRRGALGAAGGGALLVGLGAAGATSDAARQAAASRIGLAYLRAEGPAAARDLVRSAFGAATIPANLASRIAEDFRAGRTLLLQGFLLSRCEVAACLLAAGVRA